MNKFGSVLYRVTNIGFLALANLLVSMLMTEEEFGAFYTVTAGIALAISIFDVFNSKYMVNIFGQNPDSWPEIFPTRLLGSVGCGLTMSCVMALFGYGAGPAALVGLFASLLLFNSGLLTLFYCRTDAQSAIFWSTLFGTIALISLGLAVVRLPLTIEAALIVLTGYKAAESAFLLAQLKPTSLSNIFGISSTKRALTTFPRLAFYFQNVLSVAGGRLHAFLLPLFLSAKEFGLLGQAATLLSVYIFMMNYLGTDLFRRASAIGIENANWPLHIRSIALCFAGYVILLWIAVPWLYSPLKPYLPLLIVLAVIVSFSSHQGYLLFLAGLDRWIIYLSVVTPFVSLLALMLLTSWFDLLGALLAMILVEAFSVLAVLAILGSRFWRSRSISRDTSH